MPRTIKTKRSPIKLEALVPKIPVRSVNMESEDALFLYMDIEDVIKKWHKERPGDRPYGCTKSEMHKAINKLVDMITYGPRKPNKKIVRRRIK